MSGRANAPSRRSRLAAHRQKFAGARGTLPGAASREAEPGLVLRWSPHPAMATVDGSVGAAPACGERSRAAVQGERRALSAGPESLAARLGSACSPPPRRPTCLLLTLEDSSNSSITEGPRTLSSVIHRFTDEKTQTLSVRGTRLRPHGKFVPGPGPHPRPSRPLPGATSPGSAALAAGRRLRPRRGLQRVGRTTDAPSRPPPARASPVRRTCLSRQLARDSAHHEFSPAPPRTPESLLFQS